MKKCVIIFTAVHFFAPEFWSGWFAGSSPFGDFFRRKNWMAQRNGSAAKDFHDFELMGGIGLCDCKPGRVICKSAIRWWPCHVKPGRKWEKRLALAGLEKRKEMFLLWIMNEDLEKSITVNHSCFRKSGRSIKRQILAFVSVFTRGIRKMKV